MQSSNTEPIIRLAWSRRLGLPDDALAVDGERLLVEREDALSVLTLWGSTVIIGPSDLLDRASTLTKAELADPDVAAALLADRGGRNALRRPAVELLHYCDDYVAVPADGANALIAREDEKVAELAARCPPDDVIDVRPQEWQLSFVRVTDEAPHQPLAGAGYAERVGLVARLGALTAHGSRRAGHGRLVATLALHDALDAGLVVEAGVSSGNTAGEFLVRGLGFEHVGSRISAASG